MAININQIKAQQTKIGYNFNSTSDKNSDNSKKDDNIGNEAKSEVIAKQQDTFTYQSTQTAGAYTKNVATAETPATTEELAEKTPVNNPDKGMDTSGLIQNDYISSTGKIDIAQMKSDMLVNYQNMVQQMLGYQKEDGTLEVPSRVQVAAQASLEGEGYWSPESVAGRILDMAKGLSGGDASKFELLKEAALKGFEEAEKMWGGELPSITETTKDLVIKGFDDWYNELNPTQAPEVEA